MVSKEIEKYCQEHSGDVSAVLAEIERDTYAHVLKPRMLSGHLQGRLLSMISKLIQPSKILEIGTYTGFSAICLAEGLSPNGELITIEVNEEHEATIKKNIEKSGNSNKIKLILGNALHVIPNLNEIFDLVFIDADKLNYKLYYELAYSKLRIGGLIISDNVLWDQKVANIDIKDKTTQYLREFNDMLNADIRTEKVLLPIRDGLYITRKIK